MARTADEARAQALAAQAARPTAFAQMSSGLGIGADPYKSTDQFLSYLQATDPVQKPSTYKKLAEISAILAVLLLGLMEVNSSTCRHLCVVLDSLRLRHLLVVE